MYGFDIEADRRLDNEHWERRRRLRDRYHGALLGLALGSTLEFKTPGTFKPLSDMVGGGPFNLQPGQWTDDTSRRFAWAKAWCNAKGSIPRIKWIGTCAGGETAT
jgi:ADP-ribosylglycohydrolase